MEEQTATDTKAIQLIDTTKNSKKQTENDNNNNNENIDQPNTVDVKITFCSHVGWDGVLLMLFMLVVSGLLMYTTYIYTAYFSNFDRDLVWLFIAMSALFLLLVIYYIIFWRKLVKNFMKEEEEQNNTEIDNASCFEKSKTIYNEFQVFGKYYLWVLYASEISESIFQLNNILVVYTCSLPVGFSSIICIILSIDCFHTVMFMIRENDAARRDRQIIIDTLIDFFCAAVPILIMWFGYNVPILIDEMCYLSLYPAFMMLMKLDVILDEIIRSRTASAILNAQGKKAATSKRRRESLYRGVTLLEIAKQQQMVVPYGVHIGAGICKLMFGIIFFSISILHLVSANSAVCEPLLWESCVVKTPFCANLFQPTCNCAVLNVRKHNWTNFPNGIYDMNALKVMQINHGPLETIPENINEKFIKVSQLDLSFNGLKNVPKMLGGLPINQLNLENNKLSALPDSIWGNKDIFLIELDNNNISVIPPSISSSSSLTRLYISNNSLYSLPLELFALKIVTICADGNKLKVIPPDIGKMITLRHARFNNNYNITNVPKEIGNLVRLQDIDFRNNAIQSLPESFESLNALKYIYLHDNPICSNGWIDNGASTKVKDIITRNDKSGCATQCSIYCPDRFKGDEVCDSECNSLACKFDGGDC